MQWCPHVDAVEQEHREVEVRERRGSPGVELRLRLSHEPPTDRTLARAPGADVRAQRLQAAAILARRHAHEYLLDAAPVQRVVRGERPERGQRDLLAGVPDARAAQRHLAPAQDDLTGRMARPRGTPLGWMRIPGPTDRHTILLQHRLEDFQSRLDDQLLEFGRRVDQDVDQREVSEGWGFGLATPDDCARLLHGGSFLGASAPGFPTGRLSRPAGSRRFKFQQPSGHPPDQNRPANFE